MICVFRVLILSVHFSPSVMSDSLQPHESQHNRLSCPSPTPRVYPNSCPSSRWCHLAILSSVVPFSSCPQSFPTSRSFPMSQLFSSGGQSIGTLASALVLPMNFQGWSFRIDWFDLLAVQGTLKSLLKFFDTQLSLWFNSHICTWLLGKIIVLTVDLCQ